VKGGDEDLLERQRLGLEALWPKRLQAMHDAVSVAVPTPAHCDVGQVCLAAGCDVLMEKPLAIDLAEADLLLQAATRHGRLLQVGHVERFNPAVEALVAFVTSESRGIPMNVALSHAKEKEAFALGEKMFFFRGGPHDFACATCHAESNKRIRLQDLPNLTEKAGAQLAYTTWPAYRVSQGELRTFQWRLNDCFRQQRFPELEFASDASISLTTFLARNANGAAFDAPAIKR